MPLATLNAQPYRILLVDDDPGSLQLLCAGLDTLAELFFAKSGKEALQMVEQTSPHLVLLDIEMPGMNGYATCRQMKRAHDIPVIFVSSHDSLEYQLEAFEAGGSDIVLKPVQQELLKAKVALALKTHAKHAQLRQDSEAMTTVAMRFLSTVEENGVLLKFLRASVHCRNYDELGTRLCDAAKELSLYCFGEIRHAAGPTIFSTEPESLELASSVLKQVSGMGRQFQFKRQFVVNYENISLVVTNLPLEFAEKETSLRDSIVTLTETADALCENIRMRLESNERAEQLQVALMGGVKAVERLREKHTALLTDTRYLLQELVGNIEKAYSWLNTTNDQEEEISGTMQSAIDKTLHLLMTNGRYDDDFNEVLDALRGPRSGGDVDMW